MAQSGYTACRCRDCMEVAVSDDMAEPDFCLGCEEAGCEDDEECMCEGAYSDGEDDYGCEDPGFHERPTVPAPPSVPPCGEVRR